MHKPESISENEMLKIHWDFERQMDHLILVRKPDLMLKKKKNVPFSVLTDYKMKIKESEKVDKYLEFSKGLKNLQLWLMNLKQSPKTWKKTEGTWNFRKDRDHLDQCIVEIG